MIKEIRRIYDWYDGPMAFDFLDKDGHLFFAYIIDDSDRRKEMTYLVQEISESQVSSLKECRDLSHDGHDDDVEWRSLRIFSDLSKILKVEYANHEVIKVLEFRTVTQKEWKNLKSYVSESARNVR